MAEDEKTNTTHSNGAVEHKSMKSKGNVPPGDTLWSRRNFLSISGWIGIFLFFIGSITAFVRFMFPRILFEPSSMFKAGPPDEYSIGEVSEKYLSDQGVWIVREEDGFYALLAKCTHLGCTPRWLQAENKFKCPCHGSGFSKAGVNFEGPAPRALERLLISLGEDGRLIVDKSRTFQYEKGEWNKSDASLRI
jgi:cytochrome b6-f complex iron-sulfur subunit